MLGGIPIIVQISKILSWLGIGYLYYLLSAYLILKKDPRGKLLWYYWTSAAILNAILKYTFAQPRPYWVEPQIQAFEKSISFGMPSGHAQSACGILLMCLIYRLGWFWGLTWMLMISLARVILGVHSFAQVLVGLGLGVGMVLIFYFRHNDMFRFLKNKSIQWALVIVAFIYGIIAIRLGAQTIEQVSQAWVNAPIRVRRAPVQPQLATGAYLLRQAPAVSRRCGGGRRERSCAPLRCAPGDGWLRILALRLRRNPS